MPLRRSQDTAGAGAPVEQRRSLLKTQGIFDAVEQPHVTASIATVQAPFFLEGHWIFDLILSLSHVISSPIFSWGEKSYSLIIIRFLGRGKYHDSHETLEVLPRNDRFEI
jgi:hypothetical protein